MQVLLVVPRSICWTIFKCYLNLITIYFRLFFFTFFFRFLGFSRVIKNPACDCPSQFYFISFLFRCVSYFYSFIFIVLYSNRAATTFFFLFFLFFLSFFLHLLCVCLAAAASFFHHCWSLLFAWFTRCPSFIIILYFHYMVPHKKMYIHLYMTLYYCFFLMVSKTKGRPAIISFVRLWSW